MGRIPYSPCGQDNITRAGAIPPLISLLDRVELRELAAAVLAKLAHEHEDNQSDAWWQDATGRIRPQAAGAMGAWSMHQGHRSGYRSSAQIVGASASWGKTM